MENEIKKEENVKACPFINGVYLMPVRDRLGQPTFAKQTDVARCIKDNCTFYSSLSGCMIFTALQFYVLGRK